jgi:hypothetical protein
MREGCKTSAQMFQVTLSEQTRVIDRLLQLARTKTHLTRTQSRSSQRKMLPLYKAKQREARHNVKNGAPQQRQRGYRADRSWGLAVYSCLIVRLRRRHGAPSLLQEARMSQCPSALE